MAIKQLIKRTSGWLYLNSPVGRNQLHGAGVILMLHRVLANDRAADLPHRNEVGRYIIIACPLYIVGVGVWRTLTGDSRPAAEIAAVEASTGS